MSSGKEKRGLKRFLIEQEENIRQKAITEIIGSTRLSIQGLRDILSFSAEEIRIMTVSSMQRVCGDSLTITILTQDSIEIQGKITMLILTEEIVGDIK